jgi:hypothetical protein
MVDMQYRQSPVEMWKRHRRRQHIFSGIIVVALLAALIGGWLLYLTRIGVEKIPTLNSPPLPTEMLANRALLCAWLSVSFGRDAQERSEISD